MALKKLDVTEKPRKSRLKIKVLHIVSFDEFVPQGLIRNTTTTWPFCGVSGICGNHHDNAPSHFSMIVTDFMAEMRNENIA